MKSDSIKELASALSKAQAAIKGALKDSSNPFFKTKYADLSSVVEAIRQPLADNGLSYVQISHERENGAAFETMIMHSSGEWLSCGVMSVPVNKADAQGFGSSATYCRRYSLSAAFGVAPEDDDGNAAAAAAPKAPKEVHKPTDGAWESMTPDMRTYLVDLSNEVRSMLKKGDLQGVKDHLDEAKLDNDTKIALWTRFDSAERRALKEALKET